jgi:hypothetical protein
VPAGRMLGGSCSRVGSVKPGRVAKRVSALDYLRTFCRLYILAVEIKTAHPLG